MSIPSRTTHSGLLFAKPTLHTGSTNEARFSVGRIAGDAYNGTWNCGDYYLYVGSCTYKSCFNNDRGYAIRPVVILQPDVIDTSVEYDQETGWKLK